MRSSYDFSKGVRGKYAGLVLRVVPQRDAATSEAPEVLLRAVQEGGNQVAPKHQDDSDPMTDINFPAALDHIRAKAKIYGWRKLAREVGSTAQSLHHTLRAGGNPTFRILYNVCRVLDVNIMVEPLNMLKEYDRMVVIDKAKAAAEAVILKGTDGTEETLMWLTMEMARVYQEKAMIMVLSRLHRRELKL